MKYKAVLFDMDGVIIDSEPIHFAAFQSTLEHNGQSLTQADYLKHFAGRTDEDGFKEYFNSINETVDMPVILDRKTKAYLELAKDQLVAYQGVVDLIKKLAAEMSLALVTGSSKAEVNIVLNTLGISDCFSAMVCAEDVKNGKPDPEGYLKAQKMLKVHSPDCVVVEDSPSGISAAINAGFDCIAVTNTHSTDDLKAATLTVEHLSINLF